MRCPRPIMLMSTSAVGAVALLAAGCGGGGGAPGIASIASSGTTATTTTTSTTTQSGSGSAPKAAGGPGGGPSGQFQVAMNVGAADGAKFSACMRKHGVTNFPDPNGQGTITIHSGMGIDPDSPHSGPPEPSATSCSRTAASRPLHRSRRLNRSCSPSRRACVRTGSRTSPTRPAEAFGSMSSPAATSTRTTRPSGMHSRPVRDSSRSRAAGERRRAGAGGSWSGQRCCWSRPGLRSRSRIRLRPVSPGANGVGDNAAATSLTTVKRQDLTSQTQVSATLGYADVVDDGGAGGTAPADLQQVAAASVASRAAGDSAPTERALEQAQAALAADRARWRSTVDGGNAAESGGASQQGGGGGGRRPVCDRRAGRDGGPARASQPRPARCRPIGRRSRPREATLTQGEASAATYGQNRCTRCCRRSGRSIRRGAPLYAIGGEPAFLLYGSVPASARSRPGCRRGRTSPS